MPKPAAIVLHPLFVGDQFRTQVWITNDAAETIEDQSDRPDATMKKLKHFATNGFASFEGEENSCVRHERGNAWRIRTKYSSLFRLIGFYIPGMGKSGFAIITGFTKPGSGYTKGHWQRIDAVSDLRNTDGWQRSQT
ncbi:MAG: hypothetical protein KF768_01390 [Phycisphaeraceae bacterium]|nr:hypothetical protein [Phycisphaeraceae bacterium]